MIINISVNDLWLQEKSFAEWSEIFTKIAMKTKEILSLSFDFEIDVTLTDTNLMRQMNSKYRNKNKSTNVLSFPIYTKNEILHKKEQIVLLGDIVMSYNDIAEEIILYNKSFFDRAAHLFVHGLLHLLGFDHESSAESEVRMGAIEEKVLQYFDIRTPYEC